MKHTITNRLAALLLLVIGVMGCSKEETLPSGTPDTARIPITISVTDGGYEASDPSTAQSRAMENGYATTFTEDDKIGLYVVKPDGSSYAHENIELTLTDNGDDTFAWTPPADTKLYYDAEARYFAYYPYQPALTGDLFPSATDAAGFFADVVSKWAPDTDQSSYDLYTASDLMVGSGTVAPKQADGTCPLALTMTHAMALVVIETPATEYSLISDPTYTWTAAAPDTEFYDFTPYSPTGGTYRYLVKPAQNGATSLIGSYTATSGKTKEYIIEQNGIAAAKYKHYKVDGGTTTTITEKTHTLQVGDFYLKDGSLLSVSENEIPTKQQQDACIGIVYWVGDATAKDETLRDAHPGCTHGLVVALSGDESVVWQDPYRSVQDWLNDKKNGEFLSVQSGIGMSDPLNNIQGYNNTKAIEAFNADAANSDSLVTAVQKAVEYRAKVLAPSSSSDWYLPSAKELTLLCGTDVDDIYINNSGGTANRDLINDKLDSIDETTPLSSSRYWSSSEHRSNYAFDVSFYDGGVGDGGKYNFSYRVRFSLVF